MSKVDPNQPDPTKSADAQVDPTNPENPENKQKAANQAENNRLAAQSQLDAENKIAQNNEVKEQKTEKKTESSKPTETVLSDNEAFKPGDKQGGGSLAEQLSKIWSNIEKLATGAAEALTKGGLEFLSKKGESKTQTNQPKEPIPSTTDSEKPEVSKQTSEAFTQATRPAANSTPSPSPSPSASQDEEEQKGLRKS